ncbi:hypothetical protein QL996_14255 [Planococcus sp. APC 4015]|nr:hypothetical protein [Planococcus sp. APC 4015]
MNRAPLPSQLGPVFSVADAVAAGVTSSRLSALDLHRPFHGVRAVRAPSEDARASLTTSAHAARLRVAALERAHGYACIMRPTEFFTHVTAALLWDLPVPLGLLLCRDDTTPAHADHVDVGVLAPRRHPRGRGVRGHQVRRQLVRVVRHPTRGVLVASPASTWAMLGAVIAHPFDLVAVGDAIVREPMFDRDAAALASVDDLAELAGSGRRVGIAALRSSLGQIRTRSASRAETWLRLTLVEAGLPEPLLNVEVRDRLGTLIAVVDGAWPAVKVAVEYEGEHHLTDSRQWAKDIDRFERLAAAGWSVVRVTKHDLFGRPAHLVARVRRVIASHA